MRFTRITENQSYEQIVQATEDLRKNGIKEKAIREHPEVVALNLNLSRCTTAGMGLCGQGEYSGTVVTDGPTGYKVIKIFIDTLEPNETEIVDITESLGKLNPENTKCDIRNPISMAILFYLEQFGEIPENVVKHLHKSS